MDDKNFQVKMADDIVQTVNECDKEIRKLRRKLQDIDDLLEVRFWL